MTDKKVKFFTHVRSEEESEAVQEYLFRKGFRWASGSSHILHTIKPYLCWDGDDLDWWWKASPLSWMNVVGQKEMEDWVAAGQTVQEIMFSFEKALRVDDNGTRLGFKCSPASTVELEGGNYTEEELLSIIEKMRRERDEV